MEENEKNTEEKLDTGTPTTAEEVSTENASAVPADVPENASESVDVGEESVPASDDAAPADAEPSPEKPQKRRKWLKWLAIALGALLAIVILVVLVVAFCLGPITKYCANKWGAEILGVDKCQIGEAKIYPFTGYVHFENIEIGKPIGEDYAFSRNLFSAGLIDVDVDVFSLLTSKIVLDHFEVRQIEVCYEQPLSGPSNVDALLKNLGGDAVAQVSVQEDASSSAVPADEQKEIFIGARYFVIENVSVSSVVRGIPMGMPTMSCKFPDGLGMDEDLSPTAFGMRVSGNFVSVIDFVQDSVVGDAAGAVSGAVGDAATATGEAAGAAVDAVSGAASSVIGIFTGESDDDEEDEEDSADE